MQSTFYLHLTLDCTAIYQVLCGTGRSEDWPGFISCAGTGQSTELQVEYQGTYERYPWCKRGFSKVRCCGWKAPSSPSSNSFSDWLLILISLLAAACFVEWKSPHQADVACVPRQRCWEWDFLGASSQCGSDVWGKNIQMVIISCIHLIYSFFNHSTFWL